MFQNTKKRSERRAWPIHGYVGANGGGKSAAMVWDSLPSLEAGRRVLSTVRLLDYTAPRPCEGYRVDAAGEQLQCEVCVLSDKPHGQAHPLWDPFTEWVQILEAEHCDVLMDEVTGVASSRESHSMPAPVANALVQMRRRDVVIRWSAPAWARSDKIIRECSQAVTYARGYMTTASTDGDRMWRNRRLFKWATYDAADFEDFTAGKRESMRSQVVDWHWGPSSPAFKAYDTLDSVLTIGTVSVSGRCYRCDGTRKAHECVCTDYHDIKREHAAQLQIVAPKPPRGGRSAS